MVATSEISVSFTAAEHDALVRLADELRPFGDPTIATGKTILAVVGHHLPERAGIGCAVLGALANVGVNVEMISYAAGSINFSMVIADADVDRAVRALHGTLFEAG
jgi:aspartate kinase